MLIFICRILGSYTDDIFQTHNNGISLDIDDGISIDIDDINNFPFNISENGILFDMDDEQFRNLETENYEEACKKSHFGDCHNMENKAMEGIQHNYNHIISFYNQECVDLFLNNYDPPVIDVTDEYKKFEKTEASTKAICCRTNSIDLESGIVARHPILNAILESSSNSTDNCTGQNLIITEEINAEQKTNKINSWIETCSGNSAYKPSEDDQSMTSTSSLSSYSPNHDIETQDLPFSNCLIDEQNVFDMCFRSVEHDFAKLVPLFVQFIQKFAYRNFTLNNKNCFKSILELQDKTGSSVLSEINHLNMEIHKKSPIAYWLTNFAKEKASVKYWIIESYYSIIDFSKFKGMSIIERSKINCLIDDIENYIYPFSKHNCFYMKMFTFQIISNLKLSVEKMMLEQYFLHSLSLRENSIKYRKIINTLILSKYISQIDIEDISERQFIEFTSLIFGFSVENPIPNYESRPVNFIKCIYKFKTNKIENSCAEEIYKYFGILLLLLSKESKDTTNWDKNYKEGDKNLFIESMADFTKEILHVNKIFL